MYKDILTTMITSLTKFNVPESYVVYSMVTDGANNEASLKKKKIKSLMEFLLPH